MESALADPLDERATVVNLLLYHVREESQRNPEASGESRLHGKGQDWS